MVRDQSPNIVVKALIKVSSWSSNIKWNIAYKNKGNGYISQMVKLTTKWALDCMQSVQEYNTLNNERPQKKDR